MSLEQPRSYEDRRDSVRAQRIITVRHRLAKHKGHKKISPWQISVSENMSLSGLLFVSAIAYQKGDLLEIEVVMSGILDIFNGYGEVVRMTHHRGGHYLVAIKYVDLKTKPKTRSAKSLIKNSSK